MFRFLWCSWHNLEYLTLNKNHQTIQFHRSRWSYNFEFIAFVLLSYIFPGVINRHVLKNNMSTELVKSKLYNKRGSLFLIFFVFINIVPCLYLDNNCLILFFIVFLTKSSLCFMIKSISCFILSPASLVKTKWKSFGSIIIIDLLSFIIIMTWLNCFCPNWFCCEVLLSLYYADTKDIVFL